MRGLNRRIDRLGQNGFSVYPYLGNASSVAKEPTITTVVLTLYRCRKPIFKTLICVRGTTLARSVCVFSVIGGIVTKESTWRAVTVLAASSTLRVRLTQLLAIMHGLVYNTQFCQGRMLILRNIMGSEQLGHDDGAVGIRAGACEAGRQWCRFTEGSPFDVLQLRLVVLRIGRAVKHASPAFGLGADAPFFSLMGTVEGGIEEVHVKGVGGSAHSVDWLATQADQD